MRCELVGLLFTTLLPVAVITALVCLMGLLTASRNEDGVMAALAVAAAVIGAVRVGIILAYRRSPSARLEPGRWERSYASGSFAFALTVGMMGARSFWTDDPVSHLLMVGLIFAYGAGLVARISVRPWICYTSLGLSVAPFIVAMLSHWNVAYVGLGLMLATVMVASFESVEQINRTVCDHIATRQRFSELARADPLTGLPNRLMLHEGVEERLARLSGGSDRLALHFVDLDLFKAANDRYGHPTGDALLKAVAGRLSAMLRPSDIAARIGGDEFIVVQCGILDESAAETMAHRIVRRLAEPFSVDGHEIAIGATIGIAVAPTDGSTYAELLAAADAALYQAKRRQRGTFSFHRPATADGAALAIGAA